MVRFCVFILAILLWGSNIAFAEAPNTKTINVVTPEFYNAADKQGQGFYFDVMRAIYDPLNIKIEYEIMPYSRALHMIETKQADAIFSIYSAGLIKKMTQKDGLLTPQHALTVERLSAIFIKKQNLNWQGINTLKNKKIAWLRGYSYQYFLDVPVKMEELSSYDQIFPLLDRSRIDFYVDGSSVIEHIMDEYKVDKNHYQIEEIVSHNLYIGFSDTSKSQHLIKLFDKRMDELNKNGQLDTLYKKWKIEPPDHSIDD